MMFDKFYQKVISGILILNFAVLDLISIAHAEVKDAYSLDLYRLVLLEVKRRFPVHASVRDLDVEALVAQFAREGQDSPDTRLFLDRLYEAITQPGGGDAISLTSIRELKKWEMQACSAENNFAKLEDQGRLGWSEAMVLTAGGLLFLNALWVVSWGVGGAGLGLFPVTCKPSYQDVGRVECTPKVDLNCKRYWRMCETSTGDRYPVDANISNFTPVSKAIYSCALVGMPILSVLVLISWRAGRNLSNYREKAKWEKETHKIRKLQNEVYEKLHQITGIPALREIISALASGPTGDFLTLDIQEEADLGAGASLPGVF